MIFIRRCFFVFIFMLLQNSLIAQSSDFFSISGRMGIFYDFYDASAANYDSFRPRYPNNFARFSTQATFSAGEYFSMPIGIDISLGQTTYHLPQIPEENLIDYVRNPRNNIHVNPTYKWAS